MAGRGRKAVIGALLAAMAVPAWILSAQAQSVPLPTAKPKTTSAPVARPAAPFAETLNARAQAAPPAPVSNPFAALLGKPGATTALDPKQRAIIDRVSNYLSSVQTLVGKFVQVAPDGSRSEGEFYIQKPGKVRFEYNPPSPIEVIADGQSVVVRNRNLATQDLYPLSQTPLRFLLADHLDLLKDTNLVAVYADDVFITIVVEEKSAIVGTSRMMLMFSATDMQLKQWTVTDPQGYDTTVAVYNLDASKRPDPNLFRIDYTKYRN
jgi:outer membrane lipoprotein-sorting protein